MIAMALANEPKLLIADEPTTALDVTVQAQILALLARLQRELGMAMVLVTHDLGVVAEVADEIAVMYAGRIVERGSTEQVLTAPEHPYTWGLLRSIPRLENGQPATGRRAGPSSRSRADPRASSTRPPAATSIRAAPTPCPSMRASIRRWRRCPRSPLTSRPACSSPRCAPSCGRACALVRAPSRRAPPWGSRTSQASRTARQRGWRVRHMAEPLLEVRGLVKHFPLTRGVIVQRQFGAVKAVDGIDLTLMAGRNARPRRRDRLRQEHDGTPDHAAARADRR